MEIISIEENQKQIVTPFETKSVNRKFNYDKLIQEFGVEKIDDALIKRFIKVTGHLPHHFIRRGIFFAHRQLNEILDDYEKGLPIFIYTGRGPSSDSLHLGHIIPFMFTKWLQDVFNAIVVIQIADDEKYYFKDLPFKTIYELGFENAKDIICLGFNPEKTFIFSNNDYSRTMEMQNIVHELLKKVNMTTIKSVFGLELSSCAGQFMWPFYQIAASFAPCFKFINNTNVRCLIVYAIDQDPYFRISRDVAEKLGFHKPTSLMCKFLPALEGDSKMSSTLISNTIFMTDNSNEIKDKIMKHAFSGGKDTLKEHREKGADLSVDISYIWLCYFMEDDEELDRIGMEYSSGRMLTREIKEIAINVITKVIIDHQQKRALITDEVLKRFYDINKFKSL